MATVWRTLRRADATFKLLQRALQTSLTSERIGQSFQCLLGVFTVPGQLYQQKSNTWVKVKRQVRAGCTHHAHSR